MIKPELINELKRRLAWILTSYNGVDNFISYVKESLYIEPDITYRSLPLHQKIALYNRLLLLLQFEKDIISISPWNLFVDLKEQDSQIEVLNNSINITEPYKVYSVEGNLLYTVKSHLGVFGESRLDKNLLLNSVNTSIYFLRYKLYNGQEQIKLLLVNLHSNKSIVSNINSKQVPETLISNISFVNNSGLSINLYKTDSFILPDTTPISFFTNISNRHVLNNNNSKSFNVKNSCYFYIETPVIMTQTQITYPLNNIVFININTRLIFVGSNIDPGILNKQYNTNIQFSNKPLNDIITLEISPL
jgi:hypothetical protein